MTPIAPVLRLRCELGAILGLAAFETPSRGLRRFAERGEMIDDVGEIWRVACERCCAVGRGVEAGGQAARVRLGIIEGAQQRFGAFGEWPG